MLAKLLDTINECRTLSQQCRRVAISRDNATEQYFDRIQQHFLDAVSNNAPPPPAPTTTTLTDKAESKDKVQPSPTPGDKEQQPSTTQRDTVLAENQQLKEKLQQMHDIFGSLKGSTSTMTNIATQHTQQAVVDKEATTHIRQQVNDLMKEFERIRSEKGVLLSQVQQLQEQLDALNKSKEEQAHSNHDEEMSKKMEGTTSRRITAEEALDAMFQLHEDAEKQSQSTIKALRSNIEALTAELDKATLAKKHFSDLCEDLEDDLAASRDTARYHLNQFSKERAKTVNLQNTINQLRQSNKAKKDKITELYRRISVIESKHTIGVGDDHAVKRQRIG